MKTIIVRGMTCNHCVKAVMKALEQVDGIDHVRVSLASGEVRYEEKKPVDMDTIRDRIQKAGYDVG